MLKIEVSKDKIIYYNRENDVIYLNDKKVDADITKIDERIYHLLLANKSYTVEIVDFNSEEKKITISLNGKLIETIVKDKVDLLIEKLGLSINEGNKINNIKAPMPGMLIKILVSVGQEMNQGDPLLILEAMKMENIIKAPGKVKIKSLRVKTGETVEKNQILVEFE